MGLAKHIQLFYYNNLITTTHFTFRTALATAVKAQPGSVNES